VGFYDLPSKEELKTLTKLQRYVLSQHTPLLIIKRDAHAQMLDVVYALAPAAVEFEKLTAAPAAAAPSGSAPR
jgi:hypothetical protein